ncbi:alcohol dehydrogenase catalytic domain-containing protein [Butyricicoccus faecihominis]|uniref:zinc-dependent alcohol dehydrogenase n=1 Tax=Butyricicoccus faecihominis TaxID=1712515 RepID=UPI0024789DE6|nr:alcohol dehydrogenase catalytic domain-containing protein [Butyricicoccus faecihominis]MCQ5128550.1 alcohol dehydrogenase catalytic domain-containing protein [Butyricicoccus faecihominis]
MKAALFQGPGCLEVKDVPKPEVKNPDDVLIEIHAIGVCGTDIRALAVPPLYEFKKGLILGHEGTGKVVGVGSDVTGVAVGDHVVIHPNIWCGKCHYCRTGHINLCENFQHIGDSIDGVMAEFACIPERMVYKISDEVPAHIAAIAEPLACVLNGTNKARAHPGETVLILGAGPIGMLYMMLYQAMGADVCVSDTNEERLRFAAELGATYTVNPMKQDVPAFLMEKTGIGADIVVDAVGVLLDTAILAAKKGGTIVLFGINTVAQPTVHQVEIVFKELQIVGAYITKGTFPQAVDIIENHRIPVEKLVTLRVPLEQTKYGIDQMAAAKSVKTVIEVK